MKTKVVLWGLGAMGSGMARLITRKYGLEIAGAIGTRKEKCGEDLGKVIGLNEPLGVTVSNDPEEVLSQVAPGIVLHSTNSFIKNIHPELALALKQGHNVITIAEELIYPQTPALSAKLDKIAKDHQVTLLGTGINPGFIMDTMIIALTGACARVDAIQATRVNDLSSFGRTVMETQGVGKSVAEFQQGISDGTIVGHIGFMESIHMIADCMGWHLDDVVQTKEPIVSTVERETPYVKVRPGMVAGCTHIAHGFQDGKERITLKHPQQVRPEAEGVETGDYITIKGEPDMNLMIKPEIPGGTGTISVAVNSIPKVMKAPPGLCTMKDLSIPSCIPEK